MKCKVKGSMLKNRVKIFLKNGGPGEYKSSNNLLDR
jgi:hypothetical protein